MTDFHAASLASFSLTLCHYDMQVKGTAVVNAEAVKDDGGKSGASSIDRMGGTVLCPAPGQKAVSDSTMSPSFDVSPSLSVQSWL